MLKNMTILEHEKKVDFFKKEVLTSIRHSSDFQTLYRPKYHRPAALQFIKVIRTS